MTDILREFLLSQMTQITKPQNITMTTTELSATHMPTIRLEEIKLSDGEPAYNLVLGDDNGQFVRFECISRKKANAAYASIYSALQDACNANLMPL